MAVCTSIAKLEAIDETTDMLLVTTDNEIEAYMIFNYEACLVFLNQEVIVSYRKDIYNGKIVPFINTLTIPTRVTTLDRQEDIKLFCDYEDNNSNVVFEDIKIGETFIGAIMLCIECEYESSNKAVWMTLKVRDRTGRTAKIRLFDYTIEGLIYNGIYIKADIKRTKYGFNTDLIEPMEFDFPPNPEIEIAKNYVRNYFADDSYMVGLFEKTNLLDYMESYISIEKGYELVRLAVQLDILNNLKNSTDDIDFRAISYALVLQHGYITKDNIRKYSANLRTITFALQSGLPKEVSTKVMLMLDNGTGEEVIKERGVYLKVIELSNVIIRIKKEAI